MTELNVLKHNLWETWMYMANPSRSVPHSWEQLFSWIMTISIHPSSNLTAVSCRCWPVTITKPNLNSSEASYYNCNLTLVCVDRRLCNPFDSVELEDKVECGELFLQWRSRSSSLLRRIQWRSNLQNKTLRNKVT